MDASTLHIVSGMAGCPVDLVMYEGGQTRLIKTFVDKPVPLRLRVKDEFRSSVRATSRVMLLAQHDGHALRGDGHISHLEADEHGLHLDISPVQWELLERRRHVRVPIALPVALRAVSEGIRGPSVEVVTGETMDLSISGAFVKSDALPSEGALVELSLDVNGTMLRILAVVAHLTGERHGVGLHFVEYIDNARHLLQSYLTRAA